MESPQSDNCIGSCTGRKDKLNLFASSSLSTETKGDKKYENNQVALLKNLLHDIIIPGISLDARIKAYDKCATSYDQIAQTEAYAGPEILADALANFYTRSENRSTIRILDVAAGTGLVGSALYAKGFRLVDALEPSREMIKILEKRGVYQKTFLEAIKLNETVEAIPSGFYDSVVSSGGFAEGHIPPQGFLEMIRIVKPGGTIFAVIREHYLSTVVELCHLKTFMESLEVKGLCRKIMDEIVPGYSTGYNATVLGYQVIQELSSPNLWNTEQSPGKSC